MPSQVHVTFDIANNDVTACPVETFLNGLVGIHSTRKLFELVSTQVVRVRGEQGEQKFRCRVFKLILLNLNSKGPVQMH